MTSLDGDAHIEQISVTRSADGVASVSIQRPDRRNALDAVTWVALSEAIAGLRESGGVRCLILTGAGTSFAAGGDLTRFLEEVSDEPGAGRFRNRIRECIDQLLTFPAVTIAKVNGPAIGGGLELMTSCDIAIAASSAKFAMPAAMFGMVMSHVELSRLAEAVGVGNARYIAMTGAPLAASDALRMGLVHEVVSDENLGRRVLEVAMKVSEADPAAVLWTREALRQMVEHRRPASEIVDFEVACLTTDSFRERVAAYLKSRNG